MSTIEREHVDILPGRARWMLLGIVLFGLILRLAVFTGYTGIDDITYITDAYRFAEGRFDVGTYFGTARLGMVGILAILFRLFGPSLAAVALSPLFWSTLCIPLAYWTGSAVYADTRVALLGALFVAVYPLDVIYATQYFPDVGLAALMWVSFLCFYFAEQRISRLHYSAAGVALGLAYLYKATALLALLPLFLYLAYQVLYRRKWHTGYLLVAAGFAAVVVAEMLAFTAMFGDPLYRVHSLIPVQTRTPDPERVAAGLDAVRPGGVVFSPLVALLTNQEYGLFYFFIPWAMIALLLYRDKASAPLLLFFLAVGLYTLWGPTSVKAYRHLRPLERYLLPVTIPGLLLLARWIWLCLRSKARWAIVGVLVTSWLACIYVDNHRTHLSIGQALKGFRDRHPQKRFVLHPHAYMSLFVAEGFQPPENAAILEWKKESTYPLRIDPSLVVFNDVSDLDYSYVAVPLGRRDPVPPEWEEVTLCLRDRRWFAAALESWGGVVEKVARKLSPTTGYRVYLAPRLKDPAGRTEAKRACE